MRALPGVRPSVHHRQRLVHAHQGVGIRAVLAWTRQMGFIGGVAPEGVQGEFAKRRGHLALAHLLDQAFVAAQVVDQVE